jgi:excisionase family DNA binding protein
MEQEMTINEAAAALQMSPQGVHRRITRGEMKARRVGKKMWLIAASEVDRWKAAGKLKPGPKRRAASNSSDAFGAMQPGSEQPSGEQPDGEPNRSG